MYRLEFEKRVTKDLYRISRADAKRLKIAIGALAENPRPRGSIKLTSEALYRIRVGDYRVLYSVDDSQQVVSIEKVGHRKDVYL